MPRQNMNSKTSSSSVRVSYLVNLLHAKLEDPTPNLVLKKVAGITCRVFVREWKLILGIHWRGEKRHVVIYIYITKCIISTYLKMVWLGWTQHLFAQTFGTPDFSKPSRYAPIKRSPFNCFPKRASTCAQQILEVPPSQPKRWTSPSISTWPMFPVIDRHRFPKASQSFWDQVGLPMKAERTFAPWSNRINFNV